MNVLCAAHSTAAPDGNLRVEDIEELGSYLIEFHDLYRDVFQRREQWEKAQRYVRGLFANLHRRNVERLAEDGAEPVPARTLQNFMTNSTWSDQAVRIRHQAHVAETIGQADGILIVDGSDFPKKGRESAGVARQYCGNTGKIDNCQAGVFVGYFSDEGAAIVDGALYLPKSWFSDEQKANRWDECRIPKTSQFRTKPQLAIDMLGGVSERGQLPARWVLADEGFGQYADFLDAIPSVYWYFCEVPTNSRVWLQRPQTRSVQRRGGTHEELQPGQPEPGELRELLGELRLNWQPMIVKEGAKGPVMAEVARTRVVEVRRGLPGKTVWLFLRRDPQSGEMKYFLCNAPETVTIGEMTRVSGARWPIETCFEECKDRLGMDQYELRSFTGWHHHMTLVMLAHHFLHLVRLRLKKNGGAHTATDSRATPRGVAPA